MKARPLDREQLRSHAARFDRLSLRERALVVGAVLAVCWAAWDWALGSEQRRESATLQRDIGLFQQRLAAETQTQEALRAAVANDPNKALASERAELAADIEKLDARLEADVGRFVPPKQAAAMLEDVVQHHTGVTLTSLQALPAEPVKIAAEEETHLYRHDLRVELTGTYFDVVRYLADLESSKWRFGWRTLDYHVSNYPAARVTVEIETLSHDPNWLGV